MLNDDELQDALLLVFANKQDLLMVMNTVDITDKLGLQGYILETVSTHQSWHTSISTFVPHSVDLQHWRNCQLELLFHHWHNLSSSQPTMEQSSKRLVATGFWPVFYQPSSQHGDCRIQKYLFHSLVQDVGSQDKICPLWRHYFSCRLEWIFKAWEELQY